jgi:hypothetical protein
MDSLFDKSAAGQISDQPKSGGGNFKTLLFLACVGGAGFWAYKDFQKNGSWFFQRWIGLAKDAMALNQLRKEQSADGFRWS